MMITRCLLAGLALGLLIPLVAGCGKKTYELVPVKGVITVEGKPVGNLMIQLMPDGEDKDVLPEGPTSYGITDDNGAFELKTADGRLGAVKGIHRVTVVDQLEERTPQGEEPKNPPRINPMYAAISGGLKAEVQPGVDLKFDLKK